MKVGALQSLARCINEMALRALDLEDLGTSRVSRRRKRNEELMARNTLAPLAASPAGTVTLGSGLDIAANVDVIQTQRDKTLFQKHQRAMRGGTSVREGAAATDRLLPRRA